MDKRVYIDNAGTTPMAPEVVAEMTDKMSNVFGNASTTNYYGRIAKQVLEDSRHVMAKSINAAYDDEIVITSGGTESDNTAIKQTALARASEGRHIITTRFEHEAILRPLEDLEQQGYEVTYLDVDENGKVKQVFIKPETGDDKVNQFYGSVLIKKDLLMEEIRTSLSLNQLDVKRIIQKSI